MSIIKTWEESEQEDGEPWRLPATVYMQDEIDKLRAALKVAQANVEHWKSARESAMFAGEQMQAKLSAIEAQPAYDPIGAWNKGFEEGKRLAEQSQPLTKEQVEKVYAALKEADCLASLDSVDEAIEIMKGVRG